MFNRSVQLKKLLNRLLRFPIEL